MYRYFEPKAEGAISHERSGPRGYISSHHDTGASIANWPDSIIQGYTVAPIPHRGVAMRHVGPRDAAWVPLPISTWTASSPLGLRTPDRGASGKPPIHINVMIT